MSLALLPAMALQTVFLTFSMTRNFLLKTKHDALGKKNSSKEAFSDMMVRCGNGEAFCSPMMRLRFEWTSEFHNCFLVSPTP